MDGWVARSTGLASKQGDLVDHVLDRYADAFIFGGITFSAYCHFGVGIIAMMGVFFTSYMGTQAMALGLHRNYGGIMGRADRLALLFGAMLVQWGWAAYSGEASVATLDIAGNPYPLTILEIVMIIVAMGGNFTALQRASGAWKGLKEMDDESEEKISSKGSDGVTVEVESEGDAQASEGEKDPPKSEGIDPQKGPNTP
jgi:phosphatidylglycerophosphate synthase